MSTAGSTYHARVVGDDIDFNGRKVSPRGMTLAIAGDGRNAWRDLYLKFPGERHFIPASRCRREQGRAVTPPAASPTDSSPADSSPADSLNAAALTMVEALKTTLALMERASEQASARHAGGRQARHGPAARDRHPGRPLRIRLVND